MTLLKGNFLSREVKEDRKGLFVFYGGYRLRPVEATSFEKSKLVSMTRVDERDFQNLPAMKIFSDLNKYEIWVSDSAGECFRIGDHMYARKIKG